MFLLPVAVGLPIDPNPLMNSLFQINVTLCASAATALPGVATEAEGHSITLHC